MQFLCNETLFPVKLLSAALGIPQNGRLGVCQMSSVSWNASLPHLPGLADILLIVTVFYLHFMANLTLL